MIKQISVFIENKKGSLMRITKVIAEAKIDIRALCIADTSDFGILRIIVDDEKKALEVLRSNGYIVSDTEVAAVQMSDKPGALSAILETLYEENVSVEYTYAFLSKSGSDAFVVIRADDTEKAENILRAQGLHTIEKSEIDK